MRIMYCWRCRMDVPMLNEEEFGVIAGLYSGGIGGGREFRATHGIPLAGTSMEELFQPVRAAYREITGIDEPNENAIMHHRVALYGPDCAECGKPLRTPRASFCAACGHVKG